MQSDVDAEGQDAESDSTTEYDSYSSCLLLNAQSINPSAKSACNWKVPYLENIVNQKTKTTPLPFIAITETWLKSYVEDAQISLENYYVHRCDRRTRVGGGALLYTHRDLHITNTETLDNDSCQLIMCSSEPSKLIICVLYRPPTAPVADFKACLESVHEYSAGKDDWDICLLGDFNLPTISWNTGVTVSPNPSTELFENFMAEHLFSQYVLQPTRNGNTLDLFLTTSAALVTHVDVSATELSDHNMVEIFLSYNPCHPNVNVPPSFQEASFRSMDFSKADFTGINAKVQDTDWNTLLETVGLENFPASFSAQIKSKSFDEGIVPSYYKNSFISPLYKKGSRAQAANYRPVSLTSHIIKIFERVLRQRIVHFLESNGLLCTQQHGFRSGHSCLTQLLHHFDEILQNFLNGDDTDCIYLDYAKAFDKVDHSLLIKKMSKYGLHPKIVQWVDSFLCGRTQQVVVDGHLSFAALIISGVPQGTVLGPILFLIFINDITNCVSDSVIRCFADDTRLMRSISTCNDMLLLQHDLDRVVEWSLRNNMALHEDKFEYMAHSCNKKNCNLMEQLPFSSDTYHYSTSKGMLNPVNCLRDLGVTVCSDLDWTTHIKSIADKARQKAAWVFSVFHTRSQETMVTLYKSLVRSLLEYCCPVWNPKKISDIQELEGVQRTFTSRIAGCQDLDYWERLLKLSLMSLQRRRERYIILHMWKILHGDVSNDLHIEFVSRPRTGIKAKVPCLRSGSAIGHQSLFDNSFAVMGPRLWNCVPVQINKIGTFDLFKQKLTSLLMRIPDKPPTKGYSTPNSNSILDWKVDIATAELWGGQDS